MPAGHLIRGLSLVFLFFALASTPPRLVAQDAEIVSYLDAIHSMTQQAIEASQAAEGAGNLDDLKAHTDKVFEIVWGKPSGIGDGSTSGAVFSHDWKTRWQSDVDDFELETPEKFGVEPAAYLDPNDMGIVGRGRYVRKLLWAKREAEENPHLDHVINGLSNVIGWQRIDYAPARGGMPRVDLTYKWDMPSEFWQSTADTGWIHEAYSQAVNILKTNYGNDLAEAKKHAADLTRLLEKSISGVDANNNGNIEPVEMEAGLETAVQHAKLAGFAMP